MHNVSSRLMRLTRSETQVAHYVRNGLTNKEIASMLNLSVRTVEFHRDRIRDKLGLKKRKVNLRAYLASQR